MGPLQALLIAALLLLAGGALFWPEHGYFWRFQQLRRMGGRILIEDALKHLYEYEYRRRTPTVESLSGALAISGNRAVELLARVEVLGLSKSAGGELQLTPKGRDHALHIIRVHRLWEHHLAEETGVAQANWHSEAENREHDLSPDEANLLSAQMGEPVYDPHGDPIPTAAGDIAPRHGQPFTALPTGELATIVHIEDEPGEVYAQLVNEGIHLGMQVEVTQVAPEHIRFLANGDEHVLAPVVAANIFVAPLPKEEEMEGPFETLTFLKPRESGQVIRISQACRGLERRRLMDLGVVPGTVIEAEMRSPSGDPTAYRIRGALIALRREQADQIYISRQLEAA
jgi:DtxR family Mn-dependent transcriptional regulator